MSRPHATEAELQESVSRRFWSKVDVRGDDECWPWLGARHPRGYGNFRMGSRGTTRRTVKAHRVAYELEIGPIPDGLLLRHSCDNPPCCNPAHGVPGTQLQNVQDMDRRGRRGRRGLKGAANPNAILNPDLVAAIRQSGLSGPKTARALGVSKTTVYRVWNRESWL